MSFICPDCSKSCKTKGSLKLHMKSHQDMHEKEKECNVVIEQKTKECVDMKTQLKQIYSQLEQFKIDMNHKIQFQMDEIQKLL